MNTLELLKAGGVSVGELMAAGWTVQETTEFETIAQAYEAIGKDRFSPVMEPTRNDFTLRNAFWLVASDDQGPVAVVGARLDQLGEETLGGFLGRSLVRGYGEAEAGPIQDFAARIPNQIKGDIAYIGELFVRKAGRGRRNNLKNLFLLLHTLIAVKWHPSWHLAFIPNRDMLVGLDGWYWFTRKWPSPLRWNTTPLGRSDTEWLVALPQEDLAPIVEFYLNSADGR